MKNIVKLIVILCMISMVACKSDKKTAINSDQAVETQIDKLSNSPRHHEWTDLKTADGTISKAFNVYPDSARPTKAVIVILDDDQSTKEMNIVFQNIEKQLQNSSVYIRTIFLFISEPLKIKLRNILDIEELRNEQLFEQLEVFVNQIAEDYYDPIRDIPQESLEGAISNLEWNFEEGTLEGT